jgi:hypothetical protein
MRRCDAGVSEIHAQRRRNDAELRERKKPTVGELLRLSLEGWLLISKPTTSRFNHHFIFTRKKKEFGFSPFPIHFGIGNWHWQHSPLSYSNITSTVTKRNNGPLSETPRDYPETSQRQISHYEQRIII